MAAQAQPVAAQLTLQDQLKAQLEEGRRLSEAAAGSSAAAVTVVPST